MVEVEGVRSAFCGAWVIPRWAWVIPRWWRWVIPFHGVVRRGHPNPSLALILESPLHLRGGLKCFATRVMQFYGEAF